MGWVIEYLPESKEDLLKLDHSQRMQVLKAIQKVSENPLPSTEGGLGKPLGSHRGNNLTGYLKIKLLKPDLRVVYKIIRENNVMKIIVNSIQDDETVYKLTQERMK